MDISQVLNNIGTAVRFVREVRDRPDTEPFHPPPGNFCAIGPRRLARPGLVVEELERERGYLASRRILIQVKYLPRRGL